MLVFVLLCFALFGSWQAIYIYITGTDSVSPSLDCHDQPMLFLAVNSFFSGEAVDAVGT